MVTPKQIGMLGLGSRNLDLVVKKASKSRGMGPRNRCPSRSRTAMWVRPAAQPHDVPSPGVAVLFDADYAGIQAPRVSNKPAVHRLFSSPRLAYFCDVCAAQILSELELGNNFAARSPGSMIPRSLNDRCANCSITSLTCYNAATQPIASNLNTWTR